MCEEALKNRIRGLQDSTRVTKITVTRSIKGRNGDTFISFTAVTDSIQNDHDPDSASELSNGIDLRDAELMALLLGVKVDIAAAKNALASGGMPDEEYKEFEKIVKANYASILRKTVEKEAIV